MKMIFPLVYNVRGKGYKQKLESDHTLIEPVEVDVPEIDDIDRVAVVHEVSVTANQEGNQTLESGLNIYHYAGNFYIENNFVKGDPSYRSVYKLFSSQEIDEKDNKSFARDLYGYGVAHKLLCSDSYHKIFSDEEKLRVRDIVKNNKIEKMISLNEFVDSNVVYSHRKNMFFVKVNEPVIILETSSYGHKFGDFKKAHFSFRKESKDFYNRDCSHITLSELAYGRWRGKFGGDKFQLPRVDVFEPDLFSDECNFYDLSREVREITKDPLLYDKTTHHIHLWCNLRDAFKNESLKAEVYDAYVGSVYEAYDAMVVAGYIKYPNSGYIGMRDKDINVNVLGF